MTDLTVEQLEERALNKIDAKLMGAYRTLKEYEGYLDDGHFKLNEELVKTCIEAQLRNVDTLEYMRECVEMYRKFTKINAE